MKTIIIKVILIYSLFSINLPNIYAMDFIDNRDTTLRPPLSYSPAEYRRKSLSEVIENFQGSIPPVATLYANGRNIDEKAMKKLLRRMVPHVQGIFVAGSAGNLVNLSPKEVGELVKITRKVLKELDREDILVFAGARGRNAKRVAEYIEAAYKAGADACVIPPSHYRVPEREQEKPIEEDYYEYYNKILQLTESSKIPIVVYNIPLLCDGKNLSVEVIKQLKQNPRVIGIKDSSMNKDTFAGYFQLQDNKFKVFQGVSTSKGVLTGTIGTTAIKPDGIVHVTASILPDLIGELWRQVELTNSKPDDTNTVIDMQAELEKVDAAFFYDEDGNGYKYIASGLVYALSLLGIGDGSLPEGQTPLPEALHERTRKALRERRIELTFLELDGKSSQDEFVSRRDKFIDEAAQWISELPKEEYPVVAEKLEELRSSLKTLLDETYKRAAGGDKITASVMLYRNSVIVKVGNQEKTIDMFNDMKREIRPEGTGL